jgi:gamma-glutamyl:cysteine ligase YbdK (ATP-grasp superfamily)
MSELYEKYLEIESQLLAIQKQNPDGPVSEMEDELYNKMDAIWYGLDKEEIERLSKTENKLSDQLADIWYELDESEKSSIKQKHLERTTK